MLYAFVRPLAKIGISIFFRRIYLSHTENIPKNKPVILACNHPTAFLEPCILACFLDRPLYYLVRGDYFNKPIYNFLLRALHMLPVYRRRDGDYSRLKDNFATFDACIDALKSNKTLTIYPEGRTVWEYRLRPLKKGIGRIAMGLFAKYPDIEEAYIVPVGANYTDAMRFRSEVLISFGEAIPLRRYFEKYKDSPNEGVVQILKDLEPLMKKEMIIIEDPERDRYGKVMLEHDRSLRSDRLWPVLSKDPKPLENEIRMSGIINSLSDPAWKKLEKQLDSYQVQLARHDMDHKTLINKDRKTGPLFTKMTLLAVPAFIGYWINLPFVNLMRRTVRKIRRIEYHSPVMVGMSIGIYTALFLLFILLSLFSGIWWFLLFIPLFFFCGIAYIAFDHFRHQLSQQRKRDKVNEYRQQELLKMRLEILKIISDNF